MKLLNNLIRKAEDAGVRIRLMIYIAGVVSLSIGVLNRLSNLFLGYGMGIRGVLAVIALTLLIIYWSWFKPIRKHKDFIRRAEKYIENFDDTSKSIDVLKQALEIDGITKEEKLETLVRIGSLYLSDHDAINADRYFGEALDLDLDELVRGDMFFRIGESYFEAQQYSKSAKLFDGVMEIGSRNLHKMHMSKHALIILIKAYINDGQQQRAEEIYSWLLQEKVIKENSKVERLLNERI